MDHLLGLPLGCRFFLSQYCRCAYGFTKNPRLSLALGRVRQSSLKVTGNPYRCVIPRLLDGYAAWELFRSWNVTESCFVHVCISVLWTCSSIHPSDVL